MNIRYASIGAFLCIIERENGNYIIDTKNDNLGSIANLASQPFKEGYSYNKLIEDWYILLAQPESAVYAGAKSTIGF